MKSLYFLIFLFLSLYTQDSIAQGSSVPQKSERIEKIAGKSYYIHKVEKGQTLYSISKVYSVGIDEIISENPQVKEGLKADQELKIPVEKKSDKDQNFITYKVKNNETLYSISKQYDISVNDILLFNPDVKDTVKAGTVLEIPAKDKREKLKAEKISASIDKHRKNTVETVDKYDSLQVADTSCYDCKKPRPEKNYNIALMLPLYLDEIGKINVDDELNIKPARDYRSFTFIQFYEGLLIAVDSLKKASPSCKINFYVYDVTEDSISLAEIMNNPEMAKMDLIIGPVFKNNFLMLTSIVKNKKTKFVSPLSSSDNIISNKPNVFKIQATFETQLKELMKHILKTYNDDNIIIVSDSDSSEILMTVRQEIKALSDTANPLQNKFYEEIYNKAETGNVTLNLKSNKNNIILVLSNNEVFVSNYVRNLSYSGKGFNITLFGLPSWKKFENIETEYLQKLNLHLFSQSFVNYDNAETKKFVFKFREMYLTEPENYAFLGFDIGYYFMNALIRYGKNFDKCLSQLDAGLLQNEFEFYKEGSDGYENRHLNIYSYENYKLVNVDK